MSEVSAPRLGEPEFRRLRELINQFSGAKLGDDARSTMERKLETRVVALGLSSFGEYVRYLTSSEDRESELCHASAAVATHETYFFRELPQLRSFEREVLPELARMARKRRALTLWSAGCSTGEEVYTLAILVARSGLFGGWNVRIVGNDLSRSVLEVARRGVYREPSFRALPPEFEPYFVPVAGGRAVAPGVAKLCQFSHFSLLDSARVAMLGRVDAVFCRNVLIYFDAMSRERAITAFHDRLQPRGYLLLGHAESLLHAASPFELAPLAEDLAYRKPDAGAAAPADRGGR